MNYTIKIDKPSAFSLEELDDFLKLLMEQGQVAYPNLDNINNSFFLAMIYFNQRPAGIGAIKNVYKTPFDKAGIGKVKEHYNFELGYLYIKDDPNTRGLGFGKLLSKLLLNAISNEPVFATTEDIETNRMKIILESLGFKKAGLAYKGRNTNKSIALFLKPPHYI